jgi:flagellar hook-length control protein FliK
MACSTNGLFDESERCPVPRVASESNGLLPPLHNAGVRHRTAGSDSGDRASPFAALMDSADAPTAKAPASRAPANRAAQATDRSQRPSEAPAPKNESKPDRANSTNAADAADAARDPSQSKNEPEATDATETKAADSPDEKDTQDGTASATDLLDLLTATVVDSGTTAQSVPTPPAAPLSVDAALTAQNAPAGETSEVAPVAAPDASTAPAAPSAAPESTPAVDQAAADSQPATPEQSAPSSAAAADNPETTATTDGKAAGATDQQPIATKASQDPAPVANDKTVPEQTASNPLTPSEQQPANAQPDVPIAQVGKRPASKTDSTPVDARKSDATTNVEDDSGKTTAPTESKDPAAPADRHAPRRAHAEAPGVDDKQTASLAAGGHDASHKAPAESFHALLLANDQAAATTAAQTASAPASDAMEPAVPIAGLAVEIAARAQAGQSRFEIRLDPPELGRIDVRLDIDSSGQVTSRLVVERADTLEHLRRDAAGLERALQDAGLKTGENGLQFSLRDQGFAGRDDNSQSPTTARMLVPDPDLAPVDLAANAYGRMVRTGGVDIRV